MPSCFVPGCKNHSGRRLEGVTFHRIPKNQQRRAAWLHALGYPPDREPSKYSSICSLHFREEHIDRTSLSSVRLRDDAVPTVAYQSEPVTPSRSHSASPYPASASSSAACSASGSETVDIGQSTTASPPSPVPHQAVLPVHVEHSSIQEPPEPLWEYAVVGTEPSTSVEKVSSAASLPSDMRHLAVHVEQSDIQGPGDLLLEPAMIGTELPTDAGETSAAAALPSDVQCMAPPFAHVGPTDDQGTPGLLWDPLVSTDDMGSTGFQSPGEPYSPPTDQDTDESTGFQSPQEPYSPPTDQDMDFQWTIQEAAEPVQPRTSSQSRLVRLAASDHISCHGINLIMA
ncbi:uncharacterized protein LOC135399567 [Ornithodoros turicata]|uniref:uncharacterized protein LOC135399567 n=1 Tax=Ornithodoros turicata TaxID=34597 RepID=UPI00313A1BB2